MEDTDRSALAVRCAEVIGANPEESVLCQVLAYFPDKAELFIRTQLHAEKINGRKGVWCIAQHQQDGEGLNGTEYYRAGTDEHLGLRGYTGEQICKIVSHIEHLRGIGAMGYIEFFADSCISAEVVLVADDAKGMIDDESALIITTILKVMNVTDEEIEMIREVINAKKSADALEEEASRLMAQAQAKQEAAKGLRKAASLKINEKYPRAPQP